MLLSTFGTQPSEPAGDNAAGVALAGQLTTLAQTFSDAAKTHQTVQLASHIGSFRLNQCAISLTEAAAAAMHTAVKGMVSAQSLEAAQADASQKNTSTQDKLPHTSEPIVAISAKAGLGLVAGQDVVLSAGETVLLGAGQDANLAAGGAMRIHSGQAIGVLAGAVGAGKEASGTGITLIAGTGAVEVQAQAGTLQVAAKDDVSIQSKSAHIDWAAAKKIVLQTLGGASITLEGGNITVQCPGTITVRAGMKSFVGPERASYAMTSLPSKPLPPDKPFNFDLRISDTAGPDGAPLPNTPWRVVHAADPQEAILARKSLLSGTTGADGKVQLSAADSKTLREAYDRQPNGLWLQFHSKARALVLTPEHDDWDDEQRHAHALDAMGVSDTLGDTGEETTDMFTRRLVRDATQVTGGAATLNKLKG